jgi:hypothetical protein
MTLGGHPHYLSYKGGTGDVAIDRVRDDGKGSETIWRGTAPKGWSAAIPLTLGGHPHYLAFNAGTGDIVFSRVRNDGQGSEILWTGTGATGWTALVPLQLGRSIGDVSTSQNELRIGGRQGFAHNFAGRMDDVRIYDRPLTASEVNNLFVQTPADEVVWVDDAIPAGAATYPTGPIEEGWNWVRANPAPFSGGLAHQSSVAPERHQHIFTQATTGLAVNRGDRLFAYVYLDPANVPEQVMLQWDAGTTANQPDWEHRAYWGENKIGWGADGTVSCRRMGPRPPAGQWVRLEVLASQVGLEGRLVTGMAFTLFGGRATWDRAGKVGYGEELAAAEGAYRQAAYQTILSRIGTSYEEVRLARAADDTDPIRQGLADRLGIDLKPQRPDEIDTRLYLAPGQVTEASLEALFGLRDTTRDPLAATTIPDLLTWQRGHLQRLWKAQDSPPNAPPTTPPLIDPNLISEADLAPSDTNPALGLLGTRRAWVEQRLAALSSDQRPGESPLARFDWLVAAALAPTTIAQLEALMADRRVGKRIDTALADTLLTMQSFLHLMRLRNLARSGTILGEEWADLYAILVQVQKRREFPSWRAAEASLTLSPDFFRVAPVETAPPLRPWLGTARERRDWQDRLRARTEQDAAIADALATAARETETATLPQLRDALVTALGGGSLGLDTAGNWLADRLLIDARAGGLLTTTRVAQASYALQDLLVSLRTGRFANLDTSLGQHPAASWHLTGETDDFDRPWTGMGSFATWRAASLAFIYPENQLLPSLRVDPNPTAGFKSYVATGSFGTFLKQVRGRSRFTAVEARAAAVQYVKLAAAELGHPIELTGNFRITDQLTPEERDAWAKESEKWLGLYPRETKPTEWRFVAEVFFYVPLQIAYQLQQAAQYPAALDWYRLVYAYDLPHDQRIGNRQPGKRKVYYGLVKEESLPTETKRSDQWPADSLNPHHVAANRREAYTRSILLALVRCFLAYADARFATDSEESIAGARGLYIDAIDLLNSPELQPATTPGAFPPTNPVVQTLRRHAELNLAKIRDARNIAGMRRPVEPPSSLPVPQDGRPGTGVGVQPLGGRPASLWPTPYRYGTLIERAKQLVALSQQIEASYLAAMEKRDDEAYNLLKAQHDLGLSQATVDVQILREHQATAGVRIAYHQQVHSQIQADHFSELLDEGPSGYEWATLALSIVTKLESAVVSTVLGRPELPNIHGEITGTFASWERREQEWRFQETLARQDVIIGRRQVESANILLDVARKERVVSQLQASHAEATVAFLAGQFTGLELYEFMVDVLAGVYRYFLQQATAMARLAESQLAFERQDAPPSFIQADYWEIPAEGAASVEANSNAADHRGVTGSARLLADIYKLDGYAFETNTRKLQLTKTLSLARLAPFEFQRFRETGILPFQTPMELFDQDFPGHYLRLIRRVRVSMLALVPSVHGIRATLTNNGVSRVTLGNDFFETVTVHRDPEQIALSSSTNATGLFELDAQPEMLWPFEAMGVATSWELQLPKPANRFDYRTIADVLVTIEYTALNSYDYRQQVIQRLGRVQNGDRVFSVRQDFPDAWYGLYNPDPGVAADAPLKLNLQTLQDDFPPNLDDLKIRQLVLGVIRTPGVEEFEVEVTPHLTPSGDGEPQEGVSGKKARSVDGLISTRTNAASNWGGFATISPVGTWALELQAPSGDLTTLTERFKKEEVQDIIFAITYSGEAPAWPS